ncbi:MAG: trypsin-like peptidase domain-containing protein [Maribacter dokdonensis]|uniref:Do/DeqQ family serine protease n=1 Tax=Maribacter dokdonensis TaxID=320912 RepID=A0ABY0U9H2_9FLAO|nr:MULTISPECIES: trypsin-like peptidase domain-containing protein [Maribacter]APA66175.1 serine protease [Maribacter sp. 1_2014MBL_MicDiv]MBU2902462.1 trypsin-like peptidase domain-containing protein [Maribacter dokdonensis]PHN92926.1 serine protease [Maribacter sp. 6B07]CAG2531492.1 Do/DeqQ family serine protease [Maribacter dokdonensis]SDS29144.1 Do/DeqQ family serine protease [Maribacter dokdonensis]
MKRIASLLFVSVFAGAITLGAYKLFFEKENFTIITQDNNNGIVNASYTPTSARGAGINEVDFTNAAENTVNAVVHVKNITINKAPTNIFDFFYGTSGKVVPQVGTGSGVIISSDGYIVTNNHVISRANQLQVTLNNNRTYNAELIGTDPNSDIALIKIDPNEKLPYLAFGDSDQTKIGEWVLAVGNPFNLTSTVTAGIVSAKARNLGKNQSFIQTDAAVNPGNSGGALVNTNGDLVGINTAITSQTGSYVGYSFAVPSNIAKKVIQDILEYGNVQKGFMGIRPAPVNTRDAIEKGINNIDGVYIEFIEEESAAQEAGIVVGDIIKKVDEIDVHKYPDLTGYLSTKRPGDTLEIVIDRKDEQLILPLTLKERQTLVVPEMGLEVKNLTEQDKKVYKTKTGVKIIGVPERYRGYGLSEKVIVKIDDQEIGNIDDAYTAFGGISKYGKTVITMLGSNGQRDRLIFQ